MKHTDGTSAIQYYAAPVKRKKITHYKCSYCGGRDVETGVWVDLCNSLCLDPETCEVTFSLLEEWVSCFRIARPGGDDIDICDRCLKKVFDTVLGKRLGEDK